MARKFINNVEYELDNGWVIPYNPYLLNKFKCHINVEYCQNIQAIQYLFNYHFKGEDLVTIEGQNELDEISLYRTRRYISSCQGYWRLAEFGIICMVPSVQ